MADKVEQNSSPVDERYRLLFESNPHPTWVYDLNTLRILDVNPAAIRKYGYSRDEFLCLTIKDLRPKEDVPAVLASVAKAVPATELSGFWRHRKKDGTVFAVEVASHPLTYKDKAARVVVATDISKREKAEKELKLSEERFRLMVSAVKDYAILMLDPQGRIVSWNAGAERIKGYKEQEIIGQHFSRFYPAEDVARGKPEWELKIAAEKGRVEDEDWRVRKDGSRFWANVVITALRDDRGELRGFGKVTRDMTERKQAEERTRLQNAQLEAANKELEAFSYSVSHDLRSPLRGIDGFSQALLEECAETLDQTGKSYLQRIRAGTQRMGTLIDDLLNLSRVARAEIHRQHINLSALASSVVANLQKMQPERNVNVQIEEPIYAMADPHLLRIVLENLLSNAWKFTSRHACARIEFGRTSVSGSDAYFVRDDGAGFDPAYAEKLFGAFQRLHTVSEFPGTGVGLATVQRIIHRHGGKIWAESAVDKGATFYFTL